MAGIKTKKLKLRPKYFTINDLPERLKVISIKINILLNLEGVCYFFVFDNFMVKAAPDVLSGYKVNTHLANFFNCKEYGY
jgi:hypothetical protein